MISSGRKTFLLIGLLALSGTFNLSYAKKKKHSQTSPQVVLRPVACKPRVGIVTPEFLVLEKDQQPVTITVLGTCLGGISFFPSSGAALQENSLVDSSKNSAASNSPGKTSEAISQKNLSADDAPKTDVSIHPYKFSYSVKFTEPGRYTLCANDGASCSRDKGPAILVVAPDSCGTAAAPILNLQSELLPPDITPPTVASCSLPSSSADKAIIVDAGSGRTCEADDPGNPDDECLRRPQNKKPFYLDRGDTVNVMITNKNPFRETYKFSSNETVLKDDDIGSFLALLVPSLGGGSSKQSTDAGTNTGTDTGSKSVKNSSSSPFDVPVGILGSMIKMDGQEPESPSTKKSPKVVDQIDDQMQAWSKEEQKTSTALQEFENTQQKVTAVLPQQTAAKVESLHRQAEAALSESHADIEQAQEAHSEHQAAPESKKTVPSDSQQYQQNQIKREYDLKKKASDELKIANDRLNDALSLIQKQINKNNSCTDVVRQRVDNLVLNYRYFASTYNDIRNQVVSANGKDNPHYCANLLNNANGLWEILNRENEKILDTQLGLNLRDAAALLTLQKPLDMKGSAGNTSAQAEAGNSPSGRQAEPPVPANLGAGAITSSTCFMKALHTQVSPVLSSSIAALELALVNPNSLVSSFQVGPFADPTQVDWALTRTIIKPSISGISLAAFNTAIDDCINPPPAKPDTQKPKDNSSNLFGDGSTLLPTRYAVPGPQAHLQSASFHFDGLGTHLPRFPAFAAASQKSGKKSSSKPDSGKNSADSGNADQSSSDSNSSQKTGGSSNDESTVTTRGKRINFGKERFIVSIGAVWAHLSQQNIGTGLGIPQFDASGNPPPAPSPSASPTPTPATTIITQTNHSSFRISPMAFLNTRLFDWNRWNEPFYFTFGITAKSSDAGVKPEYLLGFSQSFAERHLFITGGVYLGQQTSLAGNLKINQQVPSGFTGSPPVNSVYGPGFTFGVSWRVPGLAK
ncbi:MAG: hypothetical protein ACJ71U_08725 [Terriglobales bacterium]